MSRTLSAAQSNKLNPFLNNIKHESNPFQIYTSKKRKLSNVSKRLFFKLRFKNRVLKRFRWSIKAKNKISQFFSPRSQKLYFRHSPYTRVLTPFTGNKIAKKAYTAVSATKGFRPFFVFLKSDLKYKRESRINILQSSLFWSNLTNWKLGNFVQITLDSTLKQLIQTSLTLFFKYERDFLDNFSRIDTLPANRTLFAHAPQFNVHASSVINLDQTSTIFASSNTLNLRISFLRNYSNLCAHSLSIRSEQNTLSKWKRRHTIFFRKWASFFRVNSLLELKNVIKSKNIRLKKSQNKYYVFYTHFINPSVKKKLSTRLLIPNRLIVGRDQNWSFPSYKLALNRWTNYADFTSNKGFGFRLQPTLNSGWDSQHHNTPLTWHNSKIPATIEVPKASKSSLKPIFKVLISNYERLRQHTPQRQYFYKVKTVKNLLKKNQTRVLEYREYLRPQLSRRHHVNTFLKSVCLWKTFSYSNHSATTNSKWNSLSKNTQAVPVLQKFNQTLLHAQIDPKEDNDGSLSPTSLEILSSNFTKSNLILNIHSSVTTPTPTLKKKLPKELIKKLPSIFITNISNSYREKKLYSLFKINKTSNKFDMYNKKMLKHKLKRIFQKLNAGIRLWDYIKYWSKSFRKKFRGRLKRLVRNQKWKSRRFVKNLALQSNTSFKVWKFRYHRIQRKKNPLVKNITLNHRISKAFKVFSKQFKAPVAPLKPDSNQTLVKNFKSLVNFYTIQSTSFLGNPNQLNFKRADCSLTSATTQLNQKLLPVNAATLAQTLNYLPILKLFMLKWFFVVDYQSNALKLNNPELYFHFSQCFAFRFQNQLQSFFEKAWISRYNNSNLWIIPTSNFTIRKKIIQAAADYAFSLNLSTWYYKTLIQFIESCTGRKVILHFGPFVEKILSFEDHARFAMWNQRVGGFQRIVGHRIFVYEAVKIVAMAIRLKDPTFLANWIRAMLYRMSFWKYRILFRYLKFLFRYIFMANSDYFDLRGIKLQLKGKISVAGNARTRKLVLRLGNTSHSKFDNKVAYDLSFVHTFTGILGFKLWFFY